MSSELPEEGGRQFEAEALPHVHTLLGIARCMTGNRKDAEDLVQDTYLRALRFFDQFEPGTNCRGWLIRILKNLYINSYRQTKNRPCVVDWNVVERSYTPAANTGSRCRTPEEEMIDASVHPRLLDAVTGLPSEFRSVLGLRVAQDLSYREIAEVLQVPIGTVMSRIHRARKRLQHELDDYSRSTGWSVQGRGNDPDRSAADSLVHQ